MQGSLLTLGVKLELVSQSDTLPIAAVSLGAAGSLDRAWLWCCCPCRGHLCMAVVLWPLQGSPHSHNASTLRLTETFGKKNEAGML